MPSNPECAVIWICEIGDRDCKGHIADQVTKRASRPGAAGRRAVPPTGSVATPRGAPSCHASREVDAHVRRHRRLRVRLHGGKQRCQRHDRQTHRRPKRRIRNAWPFEAGRRRPSAGRAGQPRDSIPRPPALSVPPTHPTHRIRARGGGGQESRTATRRYAWINAPRTAGQRAAPRCSAPVPRPAASSPRPLCDFIAWARTLPHYGTVSCCHLPFPQGNFIWDF